MGFRFYLVLKTGPTIGQGLFGPCRDFITIAAPCTDERCEEACTSAHKSLRFPGCYPDLSNTKCCCHYG